MLLAECERLAVSLYPSGGSASATLVYEAACEIDRQDHGEAVVLYIGDYDPAGVLIDVKIEEELRNHLVTPLTFRRLAINSDQIVDFNLPSRPRKVGELRSAEVKETVEAEAMPATIMRRMVSEAIEAYLPENALAVAKVAEQSEIDGLRFLARAYSGNTV